MVNTKMKEIYLVIKVNHLKDLEYQVMIKFPSTEIITLPVHEELILKYRLVEGKELTFEQVQEIKDQLDYGKVYQAALKMLARQSYTKADLNQKLTAKNFEMSLVRETLNKLEEIGLVNDEQYTISYIQHHSLMGKKGPKVLKQELLRKGVSEIVIDKYLSNYKEELQLEHLNKLISQQMRLNKKYGPHIIKQKIYQTLMLKGFSRSMIDLVFNEIEVDEEEDNSMLRDQAEKLFKKFEKLSEYDRKNKLVQNLMRKGFDYADISRVYGELKEESE